MTIKDVRTAVRVRIKTESLTSFKKKRLNQISGRDTRTIKKFLKIIYHNEHNLVDSSNGKINRCKLDELTLTTTKGTNPRKKVRHNLKHTFIRSSHDELQECKVNAMQLFHSLKKQDTLLKSKTNKKLPRTQSANKNRFKLECVPNNSLSRWWVGIRDSMNTYKTPSRYHRKLWLPLACSPYHENKLREGKIKTLELVYSPKKKEW
jgi:hypothetical protein